MTKPWRRDTMTTLWNPSTGCSFSEDDEKCPLYNISALVSNEVSLELDICNCLSLVSRLSSF